MRIIDFDFHYIQKKITIEQELLFYFYSYFQVIFHQQKYNMFDKCRCSQFPSSVSIREKEWGGGKIGIEARPSKLSKLEIRSVKLFLGSMWRVTFLLSYYILSYNSLHECQYNRNFCPSYYFNQHCNGEQGRVPLIKSRVSNEFYCFSLFDVAVSFKIKDQLNIDKLKYF